MIRIFFEIAVIIGIATIIGLIINKLKQPLIIGYILTGIIVGPYILNIVSSLSTIELFSKIGITLLLFLVGLHLNPKIIKEVGKVSLITGIGQVLFTSIFGFLISLLLNFSIITSIYIAIALTFSSTIIILKLLSDKGDTESLYGKISIGFLIVQDFLAIIILMIISSTINQTGPPINIIKTILLGIFVIIIVFLIGYYIIPKLTKYIARSQELLILFSISWAFVLSAIFYYLNFSIEVGAFLAGITLSLSPYRHEISSRMVPLRDFFIVLFFILLGLQMSFSNISSQIIPIILFSIFVLFGNPLIVIILMSKLGYSKRNCFLSGLTVAQISEFSLILIGLGITTGQLNNNILSIITAVGLITMTASSYMIIHADKIYPFFSKFLTIFEIKGKKIDLVSYNEKKDHEVIIFGYDRVGHDFVVNLKRNSHTFLIVDYDPITIQKLSRRKIPCIYGDVTDLELLENLDLKNTKMIISSISSFETNIIFIKKIKKINDKIIIIIFSNNIPQTFELYKEGASHVVMPHLLGGEHISSLISKYKFETKKYLEEKFNHISSFENKEELKYEEI
jgi:Kef-type K+ transport system membrane component KefB